MTRTQLAFTLAAGAAIYVAAARPTIRAPGLAMDLDGVFQLASITNTQNLGGRVDPRMATCIAYVESHFNPASVRVEAAIGDASVGLMQTLVGTAQWLYDSQGYRDFARPDFLRLFDAETSMYFGAAYLDYLRTRNGLTKGGDEQTIVRAYNGGPGGATIAATVPYWRKYQAARAELF